MSACQAQFVTPRILGDRRSLPQPRGPGKSSRRKSRSRRERFYRVCRQIIRPVGIPVQMVRSPTAEIDGHRCILCNRQNRRELAFAEAVRRAADVIAKSEIRIDRTGVGWREEVGLAKDGPMIAQRDMQIRSENDPRPTGGKSPRATFTCPCPGQPPTQTVVWRSFPTCDARRPTPGRSDAA